MLPLYGIMDFIFTSLAASNFLSKQGCTDTSIIEPFIIDEDDESIDECLSAGGFAEDSIHGAKTRLIIDPKICCELLVVLK